MSDEVTSVFCMRCSDLADPFAESSMKNCCLCHEPVWLSLATEADVKHLKFVLLCQRCASGPVQAPTPETRKALIRLGMSDQDIKRAAKIVRDSFGDKT
jgi:hypothetical protein